MRDKPLVSIVIPVYNGSIYLREAIESALNQTYTNCEILVVNDGSNDDGKTEIIAKSYGNRIRYFCKENGGVASALNLGIRNMRGEYFSWLSHDDVYYPEKIQKEVELSLQSGDPTQIIHCEYEFYDQNTGCKTPTDFHRFYSMEQLTNSVFPVLQVQIHACSALVHRSNFDRVGLFNENIRTVQDIEMWFRLLRGRKSLFLPENLYMVREHNDAGSRTESVYYAETCRLYMDLIRQMNNQELDKTFGSAWSFLIRMAGFLKSYQGDISELEERLSQCEPNQSDRERIQCLKEKLGRSTLHTGLYIWGSGQYGVRLHHELTARNIQVDGFIDNNPGCVGKERDELMCYSPQVISEEAFVLVAVRNCSSIEKQLQSMKRMNYLLKQDVDQILYKD